MLSARLKSVLGVKAHAKVAASTGTAYKLARFPAVRQVQSNWCWAAVAAMTHRHYSGSLQRPCEWAELCFKKPAGVCCADGSDCNGTFSLATALQKKSMKGTLIDDSLGPAGIETEIRAEPNGRPIVCMQYAAAHVVVIFGIQAKASGRHSIFYVDPKSGHHKASDLDEFIYDPDAGWGSTILTKKGKP